MVSVLLPLCQVSNIIFEKISTEKRSRRSMEESEKKLIRKNELYIPTNIPESRANDYFAGFGIKELTYSLVSFLIWGVIAVVIYVTTGQIIQSILLASGMFGITILIVKRDKYDESMIDQLKIIRKYRKAQKQYEYEYFNIYEGVDEQWKEQK